MGRELPDPLPEFCPSCGAPFDIPHALKCKKGGWVVRRHDEVKDAWARLFKKACSHVTMEPYLPPCTGIKFAKASTSADPDARADILARGLFTPLQDAYLDVAVIDTAADCRVGRLSPLASLRGAEARKRAKYDERALLSGTFAPLVCSVYGTLAPEASKIMALVVNGLDSEDLEKRSTVAMQRVYLQTAIVKATSAGIRARRRAQSHVAAPSPHHPEALDDCTVAVADSAPHRSSLAY